MRSLQEVIVESELKEMKPEDYQKDLQEAYPDSYPPQIGLLDKGTVFHNPSVEEHTGDRKAFKICRG